jgi:hypothetical protein
VVTLESFWGLAAGVAVGFDFNGFLAAITKLLDAAFQGPGGVWGAARSVGKNE